MLDVKHMYMKPFELLFFLFFVFWGGYQITLFEGMVLRKELVDVLVQLIEKVKVTQTCMHCLGDQGSHPRGYGKPA